MAGLFAPQCACRGRGEPVAGCYFAGHAANAGDGASRAAAKGWAFATPLVAMLLSDWVIGGYTPLVMAAVYAGLVLPAGLGLAFKRATPWLCLPLALASTLAFFLLSNAAVWWSWNTHDLAGLARCFTRGSTFLKYSLAGDLFYTAAIFGVYAGVTSRGKAATRVAATQGEAELWSAALVAGVISTAA